jgi:hypothetical protein
MTKEVTMLGPKMEGRNKFYGGIPGDNGCIYGIPYRSDGVLKIDPFKQEVFRV